MEDGTHGSDVTNVLGLEEWGVRWKRVFLNRREMVWYCEKRFRMI